MIRLALILVFSLMFCGGASGAEEPKPELSEAELELVSLTNNVRNAHGLKTLKVDARLMLQARTHCLWMAANSRLRHSGDGTENIGRGYADGRMMMAAWLSSRDGHRENILGGFTRVGVGIYVTSTGERYYCQQFGTDDEVEPVPWAKPSRWKWFRRRRLR